jgi:phosphoribosylformylglycinamidine synthase
MVYRVYVEKKPELANEAKALMAEAKDFLGIKALENLRIINRYDVQGIEPQVFDYACKTVFSEPQLDILSGQPDTAGAQVFAVEYLPGQFDQRADSAAQCIQILSQGERPLIRTAKVYALYGALSKEQMEKIKAYVINPVEAREARLELPDTLEMEYAIPTEVETLKGFTALEEAALQDFVTEYGLAMDADDIAFCRDYFREEKRDPTITEIRMIDTYWSDHCRHTTFLTRIDEVRFEDEQIEETYREYLALRQELGRTKPICLMDLATIAVQALTAQGKLDKLDASEEINACTVKIQVEVDGVQEPWLLLFKNETHNHPTEIEPFGGAATCIGGAIRDPLSGRAYVYGAMRVTGAGDPLKPVEATLPGKLPQRKLVTTAAAGYASYGNQIGLATGIVEEIYHPGYVAKRMEIGAVIGATPAGNVRREVPQPGDVVILLGGGTGRDGIGGATGSSKAHDARSVETCGAQVQKGNAPEERKLQRLFRNPVATRMIKRCNDFGAGGVSVAIGELADGLVIDLNAVPRKYEGLDGTELAISESQERMAVVVDPEDAEAFVALAGEENLNACPVAEVQEEKRLVMYWNGKKIVDVSRDFLDSNGAPKHIGVVVQKGCKPPEKVPEDFLEGYRRLAEDLNVCSQRGLSERFDSTIGAGTVMMPFGGRYQLTPAQAMVQKIPVEKKHTDDCSLMAYAYDPYLSECSPYHGAYHAVVGSVGKLIASGASFEEVYLSFQEYFPRPGKAPERWGAPLAALLGAFKAQKALGIVAIGGKDSMSGSFEDLDVPPTLVSFAVTTEKARNIVSPEFKRAGSRVVLLPPRYDGSGLPDTASLLALFDTVTRLLREKKALACHVPGHGGLAASVLKMAMGNDLGFAFEDGISLKTLFGRMDYGFLLELADTSQRPEGALTVGRVLSKREFTWRGKSIETKVLFRLYENKLESVFPCNIRQEPPCQTFTSPNSVARHSAIRVSGPRVLIPVFPGTNCEYDTAKALQDAGAVPEVLVINNLSSNGIRESVNAFAKMLSSAQMIFIPGGFSGGDEPDGSGKFITAFFRNAAIKDGVTKLLDQRDGLICGICNGFQALIKLGLVPYGKIIDTDASCPTLTYNTISRHQSRIVRTRIASNKSPWLSRTRTGEVYSVPISHGEGRFLADEALIRELAAKGQIATQYVDMEDKATSDVRFNPNGSAFAIEGITSPDGRVFGKMGHSERIGSGLYCNVPGVYDMHMFEAAVAYYQ